MNEIKDKICFTINPIYRVLADSREVYYWLLLRNKKIAEEFRKKFEKAEKSLIKTKKENNKKISGEYIMEWKAKEPVKTIKSDIKITDWIKKILNIK